MKKHVKKSLILMLAFCLLSVSFPIHADAADDSPDIMPMYTGVTLISADLSISSSGYANPTARVRVRSGYTADVTMQLCYDSGSVSYSWTDSGSGMISMNEGRFVVSGHKYYTSVHVVAYDSDGKIVDDITVRSDGVNY